MKSIWTGIQLSFFRPGWLSGLVPGRHGWLSLRADCLRAGGLHHRRDVRYHGQEAVQRRGLQGHLPKVLIFVLVGIGNLVDVYVLGQEGVLRTAVIFFYLSNEGISFLENAAHLGLPIPAKLKDVLEQLHDKGGSDNESA